jgi:deoxyribodipyrimidine photo-lyase
VLWFRRDLRLADNPALLAAVDAARADGDGQVVPLFVVDPVLWNASGPVRQAYLVASLRALDASLGGQLLLQHGNPAHLVPQVARAAGASSVHLAADFGPYGQRRDAAVEAALDVPFVRAGSPYAVAPGRVTKPDGTPYRVFTPFWKAWVQHGWRAPAMAPADVPWWMPIDCHGYPSAPDLGDLALPAAGEAAALATWSRYRDTGLADYADLRNRPDLAGTSAMSHHLRWGEIHPRTMLADLSSRDEVFGKELCWREFYADVLAQDPESARRSLDRRYDDTMRWTPADEAPALLDAWREGRTGYPFVDAGMRQLRAEGWMHNRVRMVVASFLVKDLHLPWQAGAAEFMHWLRDGDLASNAHGWQWTAGCGTDAAPFYRVFNPVLQGLKFDPDGDYVRRYVPELRHLTGPAVHEPWKAVDGYAHGYPEPIVDHGEERAIALADYAALKST